MIIQEFTKQRCNTGQSIINTIPDLVSAHCIVANTMMKSSSKQRTTSVKQDEGEKYFQHKTWQVQFFICQPTRNNLVNQDQEGVSLNELASGNQN